MKKHRFVLMLVAVLGLVVAVWIQQDGSRVASASGEARFASAPDVASIPRAFTYQGTLRLANGSLATGSFNITLRIYNQVSAGSALHTEVFSNTVVRNGNFSVIVGDAVPISSTLFDNAALYLGITIAPDAEMLPRQRLFPVPWAMQSTAAMTSTTLVKDATVNGLVINKGATNDVALRLVSSGPGWGSGTQFANTAGNATWGMYAGSDGALHITNVGGNQETIRADNGGAVTIFPDLFVSSNTWVGGGQTVVGNQTVGGVLQVNGPYILTQGFVQGNKVYAINGFNGRCAPDPGAVGLLITCNSDVAETFGTDQRTEPGDLVVFIPENRFFPAVKRSTRPYEGAIVGVVSTNPGLVFDQGQTLLSGDNSKLITDKKTVVAMVGRVPTRFSLENGPIAVGDPLTTSSIPGAAMKATKAGPIIGYAMQSSDASKDGKVLVWLQLGTYIPAETLNALNTLPDLQAQVAALKTEVAALKAGK